MSAADRMVIRTANGTYRSVPRRVGLGMISAGRAERAPAGSQPPTATSTIYVPGVDVAVVEQGVREDAPPEPHDDEHDLSIEPAPQLQYVAETTDDDVPTVEAVPLPPEPKPTARRGDWAEYADSLGVEVTSAMTKREIQQAAEEAAQSLSNLPQPALMGGRLETPEDEPVTEESVTDDEDPRT